MSSILQENAAERDPGLAAACEPWLTLDAAASDIVLCGGSLESRSCFDSGGRNLRVRLLTHGVEDAVETAIEVEPRPTAIERDLLLAAMAVAERLLAHVFQGTAAGYPVVLAVHTEEFAAGGSLGPVVEFSRASLPAAARRACIARVFARDPAHFLESGANLLAVPRDAVTLLLTLRPDAVVLDSEAVRIDGQEPDRAAATYARIACECYRGSESAAAEWLARAAHLFPGPNLPHALQLEAAGAIAEWLTGDAEVRFGALWHTLDVDWSQLVAPADWDRASATSLRELALGPAGSPGWNPLRARACAEIERRGVSFDLAPSAWDEILRRDFPMAVNLLLATGQWNNWREQTNAVAPELREASLAWIGSPHWMTSEPLLEDWVVIVRDLGGSLSDADIQRIAGLSSRSGVFPPIEWFEQLQHEDLRRLRGQFVPPAKVAEPEPEIAPPAPAAVLTAPVGATGEPTVTAQESHPDLPRSPGLRWLGLHWLWILAIAVAAFAAGVLSTLLWKHH